MKPASQNSFRTWESVQNWVDDAIRDASIKQVSPITFNFHCWRKKSISFIQIFTSESTGYLTLPQNGLSFQVSQPFLSIFGSVSFNNDKAVFNFFLFYVYVWVGDWILPMCSMCVQGLNEPEEGVGALGLKWQKVMEVWWECWELIPDSLSEQQVLRPILQSLKHFNMVFKLFQF